MNSKQLWDKLLAEDRAILDDSGQVLTPKVQLKIKGDVIENLVRTTNGRIQINLKHIEQIQHAGENIDYSIYGTPKHSMGD